uniref:Late blight resistance protein homolog R1A-3 n=1 Tax=Nicotiana sylvestris TaxID=4096 RepID=A0A1U7YJ56_NICSY|nr:PREDICTED: putative late blight resistance protein homolog R1A-3 [Nicotiana sylvestris]
MEHILVKSLLEKLLKLSREDANLIAGAETEFRLLRELVELVNACLIEVAEMRRTHQLREDLSMRIITAVYRCEDGIDNFLVHQLKNKWPKFVDSDRGRRIIENLLVKIDGLLDTMMPQSSARAQSLPSSQKYILISNTLRDVKPTKVLERWMIEIKQSNPFHYVPREMEGPESEDDEVIGFDEKAEVVIKRLLGGSGGYHDVIVPIVGVVGQGKSTLARKIYHDTRMSHEFFSCYWITVGHLGKVKDICLSFLKGLITTSRWEQYEDMNENELEKIILGILEEESRRLIVLDDVRTTDVVDFFRRIFGKDGKGHRILMTTRHVAISQYANSHPHYLKFLTPDESFELLKMKVFGRRSCPDELIELGKRMAKKCRGIPILVVIIAGALRGWRSQIEWQIFEENMVGPEMNDDDSTTMYKFLNLIYDHLTEEMKLRFLYFNIFPRGFDIPAWKLIRLWIAECLIEYNPSSSLEERAEKCLKSLVDRNLVMVIQKSSCGHIKTCRVHDLWHDFCKEEAKRWSFQQVSEDIGSRIPETTRQLCVQSSVLNDFLSRKPFGEHLRSFYCFTSKQSQVRRSLSDIKHITKAFPLLRVLDFDSGHLVFSKEFLQLFLLRYIAISGDFKVIPEPLGKFLYLQTLILNTSNSTLEIKANIWKLLRLRHLHTNVPAELPPPPIPTGEPSCLQTLSLITPKSCTKDVFAKACNLKKLGIRGNMEAFLETSKGGWRNLGELKCLERLMIYNDGSNYSSKPHLPPSFFKIRRTLKKLTLSKTMFDWSEADILGQLECLEVLKLKENAFKGMSWEVERGAFNNLQVLWIEGADLKNWEASEYHFPKLRHLVLKFCENLQAVPYELADVPSFEEMKLENTRKAAESAREIQRRKLMKSIKFKLTLSPPDTE